MTNSGEIDRFNTVWSRLEPRSRGEEGEETIRAGVRDPLWMLARQWQVGELHLEDAGSPIGAQLSIEHEELSWVRLGTDGPVVPYEPDSDGPLEAVIEREQVRREDDPPARDRAEAGLHFLRLLNRVANGDGPYTAAAFPEDFLLSDLDGPFDDRGRGFARAVEGRTLDGHAIYRRLVDRVPGIETATDWTDVTWPERPDEVLGIPDLVSDGTAIEQATKDFVDWFIEFYDEPLGAAEDAWNPARLEYEFAVATGDGDEDGDEDGMTVFEADEYPGGRLDWYDFTKSDKPLVPDDAESGDSGETDVHDTSGSTPDEDAHSEGTESKVLERMPTKATYAGMPSPRWWEFENAAVNMDAVTAAPDDPVRLLTMGFAGLYGNDWFTMPVDVPVGTYSRITDLTVMDTFGVRTTADPIRPPRGPDTDPGVDWNIYSFPGDEDPVTGEQAAPGLLVPPVLGDHQQSDPIERVLFARDEMANLAFGIEQLIEGADGRAVDRREHTEARLAVRSIHPHDDPAEESIVLANPGSEFLNLSGWTLSDGDATAYRFAEGTVLPPGGTLRLHTGGDAAGDRSTDRHWESPVSIWTDAAAVVVVDDGGREVLREPVPGDGDAIPEYLLATSVPDRWFPFKPVQTDVCAGEYRLEYALLFDADAFNAAAEQLPRPHGELLESYLDADHLQLFEEEVTRAGVEATRTYQRARWSDGSTHLWSGRRAGMGRGEGRSGLLYDVLEEDV